MDRKFAVGTVAVLALAGFAAAAASTTCKYTNNLDSVQTSKCSNQTSWSAAKDCVYKNANITSVTCDNTYLTNYCADAVTKAKDSNGNAIDGYLALPVGCLPSLACQSDASTTAHFNATDTTPYSPYTKQTGESFSVASAISCCTDNNCNVLVNSNAARAIVSGVAVVAALAFVTLF